MLCNSTDKTQKTYHTDLLVGADGAYSRTRTQLMRRIRYAREPYHVYYALQA